MVRNPVFPEYLVVRFSSKSKASVQYFEHELTQCLSGDGLNNIMCKSVVIYLICIPVAICLRYRLIQVNLLALCGCVTKYLVQHLDEEKILNLVSLEKDVDGFHPLNMGNLAMRGREPLFIPCTPKGCIELLVRSGVDIMGKKAVVIGRSNIVGLPASLLLQARPNIPSPPASVHRPFECFV